ncbi:MAG: PocR ligand-binding domain-containing protein [Spirochaetales bacterium]|nr:PocR ligand-binding domain-containing protein [Spirochaetales bacterium]
MLYNLAGLINLEIIKHMLEEFHRVSGLNSILKTDYGEVVAVFVDEQKDCEYCRLIYEKDSGYACYRSDQEALSRARDLKKPCIHACHAGLTDGVIPLFVKNEFLGAVVTGQVCIEGETDIDFSSLEQKFKLPAGKLKTAFKSVIRVDRKQFEFYINNLFWMLNYIISIEVDFHNLFQSDTSHAKKKIDMAVEIINNKFKESLNIQDVAEEVGFSTWHFSALFKKHTNHTFKDFLTRVRIEHAQFLLKSTFKTITEIAFDVGYSDSNYFSTAFKKFTGLTPSEYRNQEVESVLPAFKKKNPKDN